MKLKNPPVRVHHQRLSLWQSAFKENTLTMFSDNLAFIQRITDASGDNSSFPTYEFDPDGHVPYIFSNECNWLQGTSDRIGDCASGNFSGVIIPSARCGNKNNILPLILNGQKDLSRLFVRVQGL